MWRGRGSVKSVSDRARTAAPHRTTAAEMLADARAGLERLDPVDAARAMRQNALMLDIRSERQRAADGVVPGSRFIARNVFEWRCDPSSQWRDESVVADLSRTVIVLCNEGYQSSLAAATLRRFGFAAATDVIGGFQAWREAGLPVD
jgi:rhodanese-related sulfurtransferase